MKIRSIIATAGLALAAIGMSAPADAQPNRPNRWSQHDNGRHNGWHNGRNRRPVHCRTVWRNHHRVRVCR